MDHNLALLFRGGHLRLIEVCCSLLTLTHLDQLLTALVLLISDGLVRIGLDRNLREARGTFV